MNLGTELEEYLERAHEKAHLRQSGRSLEDVGFLSTSQARDQMTLESPVLEGLQLPLQNADGTFKFVAGIDSLT